MYKLTEVAYLRVHWGNYGNWQRENLYPKTVGSRDKEVAVDGFAFLRESFNTVTE
jgi:hypothetical protein